MRQFVKEHSLSIVLAIGYLVSTALFFSVEYGTAVADLWMNVSGMFGGGFVIVFLGRRFWERDCDPSKPPESLD